MLKWKTGYRVAHIEGVEVVRETEQTVWVSENVAWHGQPPKWKTRQRRKGSGPDAYHDTWEAAHAHLQERAERDVAAARRGLEIAQATLGNVKGMRKPAEEQTA
jgi:hypothetical protein